MKASLKLCLVVSALLVALTISGCIQPKVPQCGDHICETSIEGNPQLPTYCKQDCGTTPEETQINSKIFTSDKSVQITNMQSCGPDCISFEVNSTPIINENFWVKIIPKNSDTPAATLTMQDCSSSGNKVTCKSNLLKSLNQNTIYTFTANIPAQTTANAEPVSKKTTASLQDTSGPAATVSTTCTIGPSVTLAQGEFCLNCNESSLDDGQRKLVINGLETSGNTQIVCNASENLDIIYPTYLYEGQPLIWRFIALGQSSSRASEFTTPSASCVGNYNGWCNSWGKFMAISGTGQENNYGAWVTEAKPSTLLDLSICYSETQDCSYVYFTLGQVMGTGNEINDLPNLWVVFADDADEIQYDQYFPAVYGVPYETPLVPRKFPKNNLYAHSTQYDYKVIYPKRYLTPHSGIDGKAKYYMVFDGVNTQAQQPIPTTTSFFTMPEPLVPNIIHALNYDITLNTDPKGPHYIVTGALTKLIAQFDFKQGDQGFITEPNPKTATPHMFQDPNAGLVIKLNNQTEAVDAKWVYNGDKLKITDPTKNYKVKVTIGSDAEQGKTPKINIGLHDPSFEIVSEMWVSAKPNSDRHPYKDHPQVYEFFLAPSGGSYDIDLGKQIWTWDGGASKDLGLEFFFRIFHYDDSGADPNASIWIESLEFYGPEDNKPAPVSAPPVISNLSPMRNLPAGTSQTTLQATTNETATCKYSQSAGKNFDTEMTAFSTTGATVHSTIVTGLQNGQSYNYYVKCRDTTGNTNLQDSQISFLVYSLSFCGDGVVDAGEECERTSLNGQSCLTLGFKGGGSLTCHIANCTFDTSGCVGT